MTAITTLLLIAALGFGIARFFSAPPIPFLILAGFVASLVAPMPEDFLQDALILGVTVIVFVAGVELNPARVGRYLKPAIKIGLLQFLVLGSAGLGTALLLGFDLATGGYLALALAASSTLVVIRLLQRRRQLYEPLGRTVTGVLLLQDALVILLIPIVTGLGAGAYEVVQGLAATLGLMLLALVLLRWVSPRLMPKLAGDEELLLLAVLGVLFLFLGAAYLLDLPMISGAFLAGVALSPFPVNALVKGQVTSLGDFFSALFFAALGAILVLPSPDQLFQALAFSLIVVFLTPPLVALLAERTGFSARAGIGAGLLLAQTSEFSLIVGLQGLVLNQLEVEAFSVIALVTVFTMVLTPLVATDPVISFLTHLHPGRTRSSDAPPPRDHVLLVGCGSNGMALLEMLIVTPNEVVVVDDDPAVVERVRAAGIQALRGDAADPEILRQAGVEKARVVISTIHRVEENSALLESGTSGRVLVRALSGEDEAWIEHRGGTPIPYSDAAARDFLEWFLEGKAPPEEEMDEPPEEVGAAPER
jgi:Kef-type K+ transport system membrane component KefB